MNRKQFYDTLRASNLYTSIPSSAVATLECVLDATDGKGYPVEHTALIIATAYHEVGPALIPVRENLNYSSASRIRQVWPSRFKSNGEAAPYVKNPQKLANKVYGGRLGNTGPNDGWIYRGGGLPQTTGKENYEKVGRLVGVDLVKYPERILEPRIATVALVECMKRGTYTGKKLSDYDLPRQYAQARAIINADVAANGEKIAGYARQFEKALRAGNYLASGITSPPQPPITTPAPKPTTPTQSEPAASFWQRFLNWLSGKR